MWARRQYDLWNSEAEKKSLKKTEKQEKQSHMEKDEKVDKDQMQTDKEIESDGSNPTNE